MLTPKSSLHKRLNDLKYKTVMYNGRKIYLDVWRSSDDESITWDIAYLDVSLPEAANGTLKLKSGVVEDTTTMWLRQLAIGVLEQPTLTMSKKDAEAHDVKVPEPKLEDRYFILFYEAVKITAPKPGLVLPGVIQQPHKPQRQDHTGDLCITTHGHYPNKAQIVDYIKNKVGFTTVNINNIVEVSEGDMKVWELPLPVAEPEHA